MIDKIMTSSERERWEGRVERERERERVRWRD